MLLVLLVHEYEVHDLLNLITLLLHESVQLEKPEIIEDIEYDKYWLKEPKQNEDSYVSMHIIETHQ
jgi:hypothetical protein